jgi:hypothetical protein
VAKWDALRFSTGRLNVLFWWDTLYAQEQAFNALGLLALELFWKERLFSCETLQYGVAETTTSSVIYPPFRL